MGSPQGQVFPSSNQHPEYMGMRNFITWIIVIVSALLSVKTRTTRITLFIYIGTGRSTTLASGAGDPWGTQSTPNDLASVKLLPLDGSGEDTSVQGN